MARNITPWQFTQAVAMTWAIGGLAWLWDQTSPLGWWTLKPRTAEEREMGKYYQRHVLPHPDDPAAKEVKMSAETPENLPARFVREVGKRAQARHEAPAVEEHQERLDREAGKLWLRMRREAAKDLLAQTMRNSTE